jgi:hypothetical protein
VQDVEVLPLVLMKTLDLDVEHRRRIDVDMSKTFDLADQPFLLPLLIRRQDSRKAGSSACGSSSRSRVMSVTQPVPMVSSISPDIVGFARTTKRRGVTPLVLLLNFSGHIS